MSGANLPGVALREALVNASPTWHSYIASDGHLAVAIHTDEQAVDIVLDVLRDRPDLLVDLLRESEHAVELSPRRVYIGSACDEFTAQMRAGQGWHGFLVKVPESDDIGPSPSAAQEAVE